MLKKRMTNSFLFREKVVYLSHLDSSFWELDCFVSDEVLGGVADKKPKAN